MNSQKSGGTEHTQTACTKFFFLCPHTGAWERDYTAKHKTQGGSKPQRSLINKK